MLGLRYYACRDCDRVHAGPEEPPACGGCGGERLTEITHGSGDGGDSYFASTMRPAP